MESPEGLSEKFSQGTSFGSSDFPSGLRPSGKSDDFREFPTVFFFKTTPTHFSMFVPVLLVALRAPVFSLLVFNFFCWWSFVHSLNLPYFAIDVWFGANESCTVSNKKKSGEVMKRNKASGNFRTDQEASGSLRKHQEG